MATGQLGVVVRQLRKAVLRGEVSGRTDGQLLDDYLDRRDEAAFEALVRKHGPMVLGVCLRVLRSRPDAEDAFQATFLVLARRAADVKPRDLVGPWLHGVAYRTALKARAMAAQRRARERQVTSMPEQPAAEHEGQDGELVDRELSLLPEKYRRPMVLCYLEGKSKGEAARQLGLPEGTVSAQLARGRELLRQRLARRGLDLSPTSLASALCPTATAVTVPAALATATTQAAVRFASAGTVLAGTWAEQLAEAVLLGAATGSKFKATGFALLAFGAVLAAATGLPAPRVDSALTATTAERAEATRPRKNLRPTPAQLTVPPREKADPLEEKLRQVVPGIAAAIQAQSPLGGPARATSATIIDGRARVRIEWFALPFKPPSVIELDYRIADGELMAFWDFWGDGKGRRPFDWRRPSWVGIDGKQVVLYGEAAMKKVYDLLSQLKAIRR